MLRDHIESTIGQARYKDEVAKRTLGSRQKAAVRLVLNVHGADAAQLAAMAWRNSCVFWKGQYDATRVREDMLQERVEQYDEQHDATRAREARLRKRAEKKTSVTINLPFMRTPLVTIHGEPWWIKLCLFVPGLLVMSPVVAIYMLVAALFEFVLWLCSFALNVAIFHYLSLICLAFVEIYWPESLLEKPLGPNQEFLESLLGSKNRKILLGQDSGYTAKNGTCVKVLAEIYPDDGGWGSEIDATRRLAAYYSQLLFEKPGQTRGEYSGVALLGLCFGFYGAITGVQYVASRARVKTWMRLLFTAVYPNSPN